MSNLSPNSDFSRLKGLLLGDEKRLLAQIEQLVRRHEERVGDDDALQHSVAEVLADALREAEIRNHRELAGALAPLLVASIKREIRNAGDEVVDALYPIMGRLIAAYVASAVRDFVHQTNDQIESGLKGRFLRLRLKSLLTRTPYRTLLLREGRPLRITSIYLINRTTGVLIERWAADFDTKTPQAVDDHLVGGMLSAINNFAAEAFTVERSELRSLDLGECRIYLRASASYLLAVKTVGRVGRCSGDLVGREMQLALDKLTHAGPSRVARMREVLAELAEGLNATLIAQKKTPVLALLLLAGLSIALGAFAFQHYKNAQALAAMNTAVQDVIATDSELRSFPLRVEVAADRSKVIVSGLVPSAEARERLTQAAATRVAPAQVETQLYAIAPLDKYQELTVSLAALRNEYDAISRTASAENERRSAELSARIAQVKAELEDPFVQLSAWVRTHAVFFADEVAYRDAAAVERTLAELKGLLERANASIRIVGYTDPSGTAERNDALAVQRAEKVATDLEGVGLPRDRMKVLGRPRGMLISLDKGRFSSNRRVEFELVYAGEPMKSHMEPQSGGGPGSESYASR